MSSQSRDLEAEGGREAEAVQAGEVGLVVEEHRPSHQVVAAVVEVLRSARQLEEAAVVAVAHSRTVAAEEGRPGRWLEVMEVAEAHLLLARAVEAAQRLLVRVVPGERWMLVMEEALPGSSQVDPAPVGRLGEEEAARLIQGFSEEVVAADLAGERLSLATEAEEARHHDFVVAGERSFGPGMPEAPRICGLVLWCLRQETFPVAVEGEGREEPWLFRRVRVSRRQEAVVEPGIWVSGEMGREEASAPLRRQPNQPSQTFLEREGVVERRLVVVPGEGEEP